MPILPDVNKDYNLNVGTQADVSSAAGDAQLYGAISQLSEGIGSFAAQVAGDLNRAEARLKATDNVAKYQASYEARKKEIQNDPSITMYKQSEQVQQEWTERQKSIKQGLLDNSSSYLERAYTEDSLAGSEGKEAIEFLAFKEKRINEEVDFVQKQSLADLTLSTSDLDTTYDRANKNYKETTNSHFKNMNGLVPRENLTNFNMKAANIASVRATETALSNGKDLEALTMIMGPVAANKIMGKAQQNYIDGLDSSTDPEIHKLIQYKTDMDMLQNVDSPTQEKLIHMVMKSVFKKHAEDNSSYKKLVKNANAEAFAGVNIDENKLKEYRQLTANAPVGLTDVELMEATDPQLFALVSGAVKNARMYPLSTQQKTNDFIKEGMPNFVDVLLQTPENQGVFTRLGRGNVAIGKQMYKNKLMQYDTTQKVADFLKTRTEEDKKKFAIDPIKHSQDVFKLAPYEEDVINSFMEQGGFTANRSPKDWLAFSKALEKRMLNAESVLGGFNPLNKIATEEEIKNAKGFYDLGLNDQGQFTNFVIGLQNLPQRQREMFLEQMGHPEFIVPLLKGDMQVLDQVAKASVHYETNIKRAFIGNKEDMMTFTKEVQTSDTVNNFSRALARGNVGNTVAVRNGVNKAVEILALQYMANGASQEDAIEQASNDLIGKHVKIIDITDSYQDKNKLPVMFPKDFKYESDQVEQHFTKVFPTPENLESLNLVMPEMVKQHERYAGRDGRALWYKDIKDNFVLIPSSDASSFTFGYINPNNKREAPVKLYSMNDGRPALVEAPISKIEKIIEEGEKFKNKQGFWSNITDVFKNGYDNSDRQVHALNNIQQINNSVDYRSYLTDVSDSHLETTLKLEGYDPKIYNQVKDMKNSRGELVGRAIGGFMFKAAFDDVYKSYGKAPLATIDAYAADIKSPEDFKEKVRRYKKVVRKYANAKISDYETFPQPAKNIVEDIMFSSGPTGFSDTGIDKLLRSKKYDAVDVAMRGDPTILKGGNYNNIERLKSVQLWLNQLREMDKKPVKQYRTLQKFRAEPTKEVKTYFPRK